MEQMKSMLPKLWNKPEQCRLLTASLVLPLPATLPISNHSQLLPFLRKEQLLLLPEIAAWISLQCAHKISSVFPLAQVSGQGNTPCLSPTCPFSSGCPPMGNGMRQLQHHQNHHKSLLKSDQRSGCNAAAELHLLPFFSTYRAPIPAQGS